MKEVILVLLASLSAAFAGSSSSEEISNGADPWWEGDYGTGDWLGVRTKLEDKRVEISGGYTAEVWGNTTGGLKTGAVYTGLLDFGATVDLEKLVGWKGASVSTRWLWLSGRDASEDLVGNFLTISNIAGFNTLRMGEFWFQQDLFPRGDDGLPGLSLRVGQMIADSEFVMRTRYFTRAVETAVNLASGVPKIFQVAPKHEQFLPESLASIRPRWSHQASMTRR